MSLFSGSGVALITPFKGIKVNFEKLRELVDWNIECGTKAYKIIFTDEINGGE